MAEFFLVNRGVVEEAHIGNAPLYAQDEDVYSLTEAQGHSVRALYLYSAIADMAKEINIPFGKQKVVSAQVAYPKKCSTQYRVSENGLTVSFERGKSARFFEIQL